MFRAVSTYGRCIQYEAKGQLPPMNPILCTEPMELVHIDYVGMEVTVAAKEKSVVKKRSGCSGSLHPLRAGICD